VVLLDVLRRGRGLVMRAVGIVGVVWVGRGGARPLGGAWQTVGLLVRRVLRVLGVLRVLRVLRMLGMLRVWQRVLVGSHVWARLLGRQRQCLAHVGGRRRIGAVGGLLGRGRLPVGGQLALAALVREHGGEAVAGGRAGQDRAEQSRR
jgi:hypothetical protein